MIEAMDQVFTRSNLIHAVSGASGSVLSLTLFYPLDSLRTRLQVGEQSNPVTVLRTVVKNDGALALYNGWLAVISSICASNFVYFYAYSALKTLSPPSTPSPLRDLSSAVLAGFANVLITTPLWVANTRLKLQSGQKGQRRYSGLVDCLLRIVRAEGVFGLWSGTGTSLLLVAAPAVHFVLYETFKRWGARLLLTDDLPGAFVFLASGLAKLLATVVTYPLQVVQSRMRAGKEDERQRRSLVWVIRLLLKQGGILALYKGFETKVMQTVLTTAFMFLFYEKLVSLIRHLLQAD